MATETTRANVPRTNWSQSRTQSDSAAMTALHPKRLRRYARISKMGDDGIEPPTITL